MLRLVDLCKIAAIAAMVLLPQQAARASDADLAGERDKLFLALQIQPNDTEIMLRYAQLSAKLGFYEGSISTLERLLDIEPGNIAARFHLAVAYYALGSYTLANVHFSLLLEVPNLDPVARARILQFTQQIEKRTRTASAKGFVSIGASYLLENDDGNRDHTFGTILTGEMVHTLDMGGPHENEWITEAGGQVLFTYDGLEFHQSAVYVRTGPNLTVDGETFGLKIRPFLEGDIYTHHSDDDSQALAAGLQIKNAHGRQLRSFGSVKIGHRWRDQADSDGAYSEILAGLGYRPVRDLEIRTSLFAQSDWSESTDLAHDELGAKISTHLDFENPLTPKGKKWAWENYLQVSTRDFDCACDDEVLKLGTALRAQFENDYFADFNYAFSYANEDDGAGDISSHQATVSVGREF